jgi:hypothetical protein
MTIDPDERLIGKPNRLTPKTKRLYSTSNSVLNELKAQTVEKFQTNVYDGITEWYGIVLRAPLETDDSKTTSVRVRIPEVHAHLPVPKSSKDNNIIDLYPEYVSQKRIPLIAGQVIRVSHRDKNHAQFRYENGIILETDGFGFSGFAAGYSGAGAVCKGNSSSGVTPTTGKPITGANHAKKESNANPRKVNSTTDSTRVTESDRQKNKAPASKTTYKKTTSAKQAPACGKKSLIPSKPRRTRRRKAPTVAVANRGNYAAFKKAVGKRESSNHYEANRWLRVWTDRKTGKPKKKRAMSFFWGMWQLGHAARAEVGAHPSIIPWNKFIQPSLQEKFGDRWWKLKYLEAHSTRSLRNAINAGEAHGQKIDVSGIMGMAHISGIDAVQKFLRTGVITYDGLGTPNTEYLGKFYGYDVSAVKSIDWDRKKAKAAWWDLTGKNAKVKKRGVWISGGYNSRDYYPNTPNPPASWKVWGA